MHSQPFRALNPLKATVDYEELYGNIEAQLASFGGNLVGMSQDFDPPTQTEVGAVLPAWFINRFAAGTSVMELMFQPIINITDRSIVGAESLLRWFAPDGGFVSNGDWIPAAEQARLMAEVDAWVMFSVMRAAEEFHKINPDFIISSNITPDYLTPDTAHTASRIAKEVGIDTSKLVFEITETAATMNVGLVEQAVQELRSHGFGVHLDDFGTGHSALTHILDMAVSGVKLDRAFTAALDKQKSRAVAKAVFSIASESQIDCIAEGIETEEQERALLDIGYVLGQGWLYGRAEPLENLKKKI